MRKEVVRKDIYSTGVTILISSVSFVIAAVLGGIITNSTGTVIDWLKNLFFASFSANPWSWIISFASLLVVVGTFYVVQRNRIKNRALTLANSIIESDDILLRLLADLINTKDSQAEMKSLLTYLLREARDTFDGRINRASIFLPDTTGEFLKISAQFGMPAESVEQTRFYVGGDRYTKRGVAGEAFLRKELHVVHLNQVNGKWQADYDQYTVSSENRYPSYRSFICVPIIGPTSELNKAEAIEEKGVTCFGVVCFDSLKPTTFDDPSLQEILRLFARRIAVSLSIHQHLQVLQNLK